MRKSGQTDGRTAFTSDRFSADMRAHFTLNVVNTKCVLHKKYIALNTTLAALLTVRTLYLNLLKPSGNFTYHQIQD
jgi:hypothetical protein